MSPSLPLVTVISQVYCGHEYSLQNLAFGAHVEPGNKVAQEPLYECCQYLQHVQAIADKIKWCQDQRSLDPALPTVPSTIQEEKEINPFMRVKLTVCISFTPSAGGGGHGTEAHRY